MCSMCVFLRAVAVSPVHGVAWPVYLVLSEYEELLLLQFEIRSIEIWSIEIFQASTQINATTTLQLLSLSVNEMHSVTLYCNK